MTVDHIRVLREAGYTLDRDQFNITVGRERAQTIHVAADNDGSLRCWSIVAAPAAAAMMTEGPLFLMRQNRLSELVGFTVDNRGRWLAQLTLPPVEMDAEELTTGLALLAAAADRLESLLTGADKY